jgi:hypothetical protein
MASINTLIPERKDILISQYLLMEQKARISVSKHGPITVTAVFG